MKQKLLLLVCLLLGIINSRAQGTYVNKNYQDSTGSPVFNPMLNPLGLQYSKSLALANGSVITVGYTTGSGGGQDILLVKKNDAGVVSFSVTYNTSGSNNDYGISVSTCTNGDFLVCGTTDNGGTTNYDIVILRYSSTGTLLYSATRNASAGKNDVAVDIRELSTGRIIVLANTEATNGFSNFWVLKYGSTLTFSNALTYDYAGYNDIAIGLGKATTGQITVIGASASSSITADYVQAVYNTGALGFSSQTRSSLSGTVLDQGLAFCRDASNNTYITGRAWNGTNFDIKTIKIDSSYALAWTHTLNPNGMDDAGSAITLDQTTGDIIVGGYATNSSNKKEIVCTRLSSSTGALIGSIFNQSSENTSGDAYIQQVTTGTNGATYFIAGEKGNSGFNQVVVGKIKDTNGATVWQKKVQSPTYNILPSDIITDTEGNIVVISVKNATTSSYITTSYSELELDTAIKTYGAAIYKKNELIVRFVASALSSTVINNLVGTSEREFGDLKDFMTPTAYSTLTTAIGSDCLDCKYKAVRMFLGMKTTDTIATSHLGESIKVPDFWTALDVVLPANFAVSKAHGIFNKIPSIVDYAHPNLIPVKLSVPNDSLYNQQLSLHSSTLYPNSDVNVEEAYDVIHNGGQPIIRCGVYDSPADWEHKEFGFNGTTSSSKLNGRNFRINGTIGGVPLKSVVHSSIYGSGTDPHGSSVAGIIGAKRNNIKGVVGIAGGNDSTGSKGISMYNYGILEPALIGGNGGAGNLIYNIITYTARDSASVGTVTNNINLAYTDRINIQNHSWGLYTPPLDTGWYANQNNSILLIQEAIHFVNRLKVTVVASRGNNNSGFGGPTIPLYPASCDDDWVMSVTGTGTDGNYIKNGVNGELTSSYGGNVDIAAPATTSLVTSLYSPSSGSGATNQYVAFQGTSASAPHVSGAVGLIMSYLYDPTNAYATYPTPEDCEAIIQYSGTDTDSLGYDQLTGFGRLNIGKAMKLIEKPYHTLWHFNTKAPFSYSINKTLYSAVDTIRTIERWSRRNANGTYTPFPKGKYIVKTYKITSTVNHNIPNTDTIVSVLGGSNNAYWPRPSSSVTFPLFTGSGSNKKITPREKTKITSLNNNSATLEGYIYQVKDSTGTSVGWWPVDTGFVNTTTYNYGQWAEYSVLTKNFSNVIGVKEQTENEKNISLFPNPTNGNLTLEIKTNKVCNLTVEMYDIMGRKLKTVYNGKSENDKTIINNDVANLPNSVYFYNISINGLKTVKKFIKQ